MGHPDSSGKPARISPPSYSAWYGFARREIHAGRLVRIRPLWGRIAAAMICLAMVFWISKSVALFYFFKEARNFEDVSFTDMIVFPVNRTNVRVQQGDYQIEQAELALENEDYQRAFAMLREGLARSPGNVEGRILLVRLYSGWRPDLAIELLVDGIDQGVRDKDFIGLLCATLSRQKKDEQMLEITASLVKEDLNPEVRQLLLVSRMQSAIHLGRFNVARELFETTDLKNTMDGLLLGTQMYYKAGRSDEAIKVLNDGIRVIPEENATPLYNQLIRICKSTGRHSEAREYALNLMLKHPLDWRPRVTLIDVLSASGMAGRRDAEIKSIIREFRDEEQAMIAMAQLSADYGNVEAAEMLYEIALENGYSLGFFSLTLAEAMVQAGLNQPAIELCNQLIKEDPPWMENFQASFNAIRSLAYFGIGDSELGSLYLNNFIQSRQTNAYQLFQAAMRYREMDMNQQALRILLESYNRDSRNESVLAEIIEVEMNLGNFFSLNEHVRQLINLRRPEYSKIEFIYNGLKSDRFLFTGGRDDLLAALEKLLAERTMLQGWKIWQTKQQPEPGIAG